MSSELRTLILRLNRPCRDAMERAAELCAQQTHFSVDPEHLLIRLLETPASDLRVILDHFAIAPERVTTQLQTALDGFKRGNGRTPVISNQVPALLEQAWVISSVALGEQQIRSGAILLAALESDTLRGLLVDSAPSLLQIPREALRNTLPTLVAGLEEGKASAASASTPAAATRHSKATTPALDQFTIDLTALAAAGKFDTIRGRDLEVRQLIEILLRRRQNNPILTGEAGVGKTAVVEGFAQKIVRGEVPPALQGISVRMLDLGLLQAGAGVKGEFENRLKMVIAEVKASVTPIVLFIDEAHQLIGAGGSEGAGDAANLLKPALARGELRTIAATTWAEYKKYVERDPALARRFQVVKVNEPTEAVATDMLRGIVESLEAHHKVHILDIAVREAVRLSHRFITGRQLPDKAISILDTACARVAQAQAGVPEGIESITRRIEDIGHQLRIHQREAAAGQDHRQAIADAQAALQAAKAEQETLQARLSAERGLVEAIVACRAKTRAHADHGTDSGSGSAAADDSTELKRLEAELRALQGERALVPAAVDAGSVAAVIASWTGIPVGRMLDDEHQAVLNLHDRLRERIVGQDDALDTITRRIRTYRAGLDDPSKPVGVFLLVGPSGVGKTETACQLADLLFGGQQHMVTVNMSEFQEAHSVSGLKGAPPGYVGYGKGGVLTEAVRRQPYSLVLLDEMEKAHPDVLELFFQVFDKGVMEDAEGTLIDFRNTLILLTSNAAQDVVVDTCTRQPAASTAAVVEALRPALLEQFPSAFLGRVVIVPYRPMADAQIQRIVGLKLAQLAARVLSNHGAQFTWDASVSSAIAARCTEVESGARNIDHIVTQTLLPELASAVLQRIAAHAPFSAVHLSLDAHGEFCFTLTDAEAAS
jgi:type VI secretion system protein VasG